jgi:hypothetical protein
MFSFVVEKQIVVQRKGLQGHKTKQIHTKQILEPQ